MLMITKRPRSRQMDPRDKIFLAFEGIKTEPQYFDGLLEKEEKNINVTIIPLHRGPGREGSSNPQKIVSMVHDYQKWLCDDILSVDLFVELVLYDAYRKTKNEFLGEKFNELKHAVTHTQYTDGGRTTITDKNGALKVCEKIIKGASIPSRAIPGGPPQDPKFFIIVDRDPKSFTAEQCDNVKKRCEECGFSLIVSNPCFEIWLLLHSDVGKEEIIRHATPKLLKELHKRVTGEDGNLNFNYYHRKIDHAMQRLRTEGYCENMNGLLSEPNPDGSADENSIGTNIGELMGIIFEKRYPK